MKRLFPPIAAVLAISLCLSTTGWADEQAGEEKKPAAPAADSTERIQQLIKDLDSEKFEVRQKATEELEKLGDKAKKDLEAALKDKPGLEMRQRLEKLLAKLTPAAPREGEVKLPPELAERIKDLPPETQERIKQLYERAMKNKLPARRGITVVAPGKGGRPTVIPVKPARSNNN